MTMITLSEQNWDQYMYFLIHKARVTWLLAPYFLDLLYFQHNILFNFLLACNPKKFLVDVYKLGCFVLNTVSETKILRDCSLFMGMTGSEKKWPGHEKYLFWIDRLLNFWRSKQPGSEKHALLYGNIRQLNC